MAIFYKRLRRAFLFQTAVGVLTFLGVLWLDQAGISLTALLFFRPWILGRGRSEPEEEVREIHKNAFWIGIGITAVALLLATLALEFGIITSGRPLVLLLLLILPLFVMSHGLAGYVLVSTRASD
jgi:hypothetical protein